MIYKFIFILICFLLMELYNKIKNKKCKVIVFFLLVVYISISSAFRTYIFPNNVGADYNEYFNWYNVMAFSKINLFEKNYAFNLLICICKYFSNNYMFFLFVCSFIINFFILKFISNNSKNFSISGLFYISFFLFSTYNGMRQWIACSILIYSLKYINNHELIKYIILVIIASLFHNTALLFLLLYPYLSKKHKLLKNEFIIIIVSIFSFIFCNQIIELLELMCLKFNIDYFSKYTQEYLISQSGNLTTLFISCIILIYISIFYVKKYDRKIEIENNYITYYFLLIIPFSLLASKNGIFNRYLIYFVPSLFAMVDKSIEIFNYYSKKRIMFIVVCLTFIKFIIE